MLPRMSKHLSLNTVLSPRIAPGPCAGREDRDCSRGGAEGKDQEGQNTLETAALHPAPQSFTLTSIQTPQVQRAYWELFLCLLCERTGEGEAREVHMALLREQKGNEGAVALEVFGLESLNETYAYLVHGLFGLFELVLQILLMKSVAYLLLSFVSKSLLRQSGVSVLSLPHQFEVLRLLFRQLPLQGPDLLLVRLSRLGFRSLELADSQDPLDFFLDGQQLLTQGLEPNSVGDGGGVTSPEVLLIGADGLQVVLVHLSDGCSCLVANVSSAMHMRVLFERENNLFSGSGHERSELAMHAMQSVQEIVSVAQSFEHLESGHGVPDPALQVAGPTCELTEQHKVSPLPRMAFAEDSVGPDAVVHRLFKDGCILLHTLRTSE